MKKKLLLMLTLIGSVFLVGCGSGSSGGVSFYQKGLAVTYSLEENGKFTTNDSVYDRNKFTAAHKELPYGTKVVVTNLNNGRNTKVTINDHRMPEKKCIIKLSEKAAKELALFEEDEVSIDIISWG